MSEERIQDAIVHCPHCGHSVHVDIDLSEDEQDYMDECQACGGEIHLQLSLQPSDEKYHLHINADDEQYY
ncbi:MAG: cysterine-rich protein [Idiomarinaceae bacterium HL-53]|nr:MAG: cysterine-rich protein [Idiomarinaceae bacterium HL-53]CUS48883.1 Cysteine-rich CPXCG [Idiomarinaceae bacterium HL-53]